MYSFMQELNEYLERVSRLNDDLTNREEEINRLASRHRRQERKLNKLTGKILARFFLSFCFVYSIQVITVV